MKKTALCILIPVMSVALCTSCEVMAPSECCESRIIEIIWETGFAATRSFDPDENKLSDLNVFIFTEDGLLEEHLYLELSPDMSPGMEITVLNGVSYKIGICANFGYSLGSIGCLAELEASRFYLAYPDEYGRGIPMYGSATLSSGSDRVSVRLERMMALLTLRMDRSALDSDVRVKVRSVAIGGCPRSATVGLPNTVLSEDNIFREGFSKRDEEADALNISEQGYLSRELKLYMLENVHEAGRQVPDGLLPYIEMELEYSSSSWFNLPGSYLIYRFRPGAEEDYYSVRRNCRYDCTVRPTGDGLSETGWRVDKSALVRYGPSLINITPGNYIEGRVGESIHVRAETEPDSSPVFVGMEELDFDEQRGIYSYDLDGDGRGVTLHLKKPGSGLLYFECGEPVSDSAVVVVVVS